MNGKASAGRRQRWLCALMILAAVPARAQQAGASQGTSGSAPRTAEQAPAEPQRPKLIAGSEGFALESPAGDFRLRLGGYLQGDGRLYAGDSSNLGTDSFLLRRVRPQLQGTLGKRFDFYLMTDFGGGGTSVQDAYLDARFSPLLRVRVGKFKPPVGLERLQSGANLLFVERALPTALVPNRDVGVQLHGELGGGRLAYALALQNGTQDGGSSDGDGNDSKDVALRVFARPGLGRADVWHGLGLGIAGQLGRQTTLASQSYRTPGQLAFFSYASGVAQDGTRRRLVPQGYFYSGPFGLLGEYAISSTPLTGPGGRGRIHNAAWQLAGSWSLTGEPAGFSPRSPARPFDPAKGHWGALELAVRIHRLRVDADVFALGLADAERSARQATAWAAGLNWSLSRNVRYVFDYEQTSFAGGAVSGDRPTERALLLRAQVLF
jgi:phosphate-selective porin OprO/OprP